MPIFSSTDDIDVLSHDLNSPLGLLLPSLAVARDQLPKDDPLAPILLESFFAAQRQQILLDNMLDYFRLAEAGELRVQRENCNMAEVIDHYRAEFVPSRIKVEFETEPESIVVYSDRYWLKRMMMALVDNALRFCTSQNEVLVRPIPLGFEVADTGRAVLLGSETDLWLYQRQFEIRQLGGRTSVGFNLPFVFALARYLGGIPQIRRADDWTIFGVQFV